MMEDEEAKERHIYKERGKHVFILTNAGKPIFSRYGDVEELSDKIAVIQAVISNAENYGDELNVVSSFDRNIVFLKAGPLNLVVIARKSENSTLLRKLLTYLNNHILFTITKSGILQLQKNPSFDLRRLLIGTDASLKSLIHLSNSSPSIMLDAVPVLKLNESVRIEIVKILTSFKGSNLLFSILISSDGRLIAYVNTKNKMCALHPQDLILLINLVSSIPSLRNNESWNPLCLPTFNNAGYLQSLIAFMPPKKEVCLLLISLDDLKERPDKEITLLDAHMSRLKIKEKIFESLSTSSISNAIHEAISSPVSYNIEKVGIKDLWHFVYHFKALNQYLSSDFHSSIRLKHEKKRFFHIYQHLSSQLLCKLSNRSQICEVTNTEVSVALAGPDFDLYVIFAPITKAVDVNAYCATIIKWVKESEADMCFALNSSVW